MKIMIVVIPKVYSDFVTLWNDVHNNIVYIFFFARN